MSAVLAPRRRSRSHTWVVARALALWTGVALGLAAPAAAQQTVNAGFDTLNCGAGGTDEANLVDAAGGLTYTNMICLDGPGYSAIRASGYGVGTTSSPHVATPYVGRTGEISRPGERFSLTSVMATSAWRDGMTVTWTGYRGATTVGTVVHIPSATAPTLVDLSALSNVDRVTIERSGGTLHPGYDAGWEGDNVVLDNLRYTLLPSQVTITVTPPTNGTLTCTPNPVPIGETITCNATPATNYVLTGFTGCTRVGTTNSCTLTNVLAPATISATFALVTYPITATPPTNGTLSCTPNPVPHGSSTTCTAVPDATYELTAFTGCIRDGSTNTCTLTNVTAPATVSAAFARAPVTIAITSPTNGTLSCTPNPVTFGGNATCTATPAPGFELTGFTGCTRIGMTNTCTLTNVSAATTVAASFGVPVPTLNEWALMLLGLGAAGLGARRLRRQN